MPGTIRRLIAKTHSETFERIVAEAKERGNISEISPQDLKGLLDGDCSNLLVIDVREESERADFYVEGTTHIGRGVLEAKIEQTLSLDKAKNTTIITVCSGGYRSALAAASLVSMEYPNVRSLKNGLRAYLEQDYDNIVENNPVYKVDSNASLSMFSGPK